MLIYRHHTCSDIIDIDDKTGRWTPVEDDDDNPIIVGLMTMAQRAEFKIGGSYAVEDDTRFYFHWTEERELVLRTDDLRLALFRRAPGGGLVELLPQMKVEVRPATYGDGRKMPGMCTFTVSDGDKVLVDVLYDSARYVRYYLGNFTFVPDEDLGEWDFFVAVEREFAELRTLARARAAIEAGPAWQAALASRRSRCVAANPHRAPVSGRACIARRGVGAWSRAKRHLPSTMRPASWRGFLRGTMPPPLHEPAPDMRRR